MTDLNSKYLKLSLLYNQVDQHREHDMAAINQAMDALLELFSEEITWDKLHVTDRTTQMYQLTKVIQAVKNVTSESNRKANEVLNNE